MSTKFHAVIKNQTLVVNLSTEFQVHFKFEFYGFGQFGQNKVELEIGNQLITLKLHSLYLNNIKFIIIFCLCKFNGIRIKTVN